MKLGLSRRVGVALAAVAVLGLGAAGTLRFFKAEALRRAAITVAADHARQLETVQKTIAELRQNEALAIQAAARKASGLRLIAISEEHRQAAVAAMPPFESGLEVPIPFTHFESGGTKAELRYTPSTGLSTLDIADYRAVTFSRQGFPLKLVSLGPARFAVFFREMPSSRLFVNILDGAGMREIQLAGPGDAEPVLRESIAWDGRLLGILYDNQRRVNEVVEVDLAAAAETQAPRVIAALPTLEDPAGSNYEMMATLFMLPGRDRLWIVGGTLVSSLSKNEFAVVGRLSACERAQDVALSEQGPTVLCLAKRKDGSAFLLSRWEAGGLVGGYEDIAADGVPFDLAVKAGRPTTDQAFSPAGIAGLLRRDLAGSQVSGVMELGTNNLEGRVAWSQIYFLNGLLDLLLISRSDERAFERFAPLIGEVKRRLDIEMSALDRVLASAVGYEAKAFTAHREPRIFAVQTARLLLLANRYRREVPHGASLPAFEGLRQRVFELQGHIDAFQVSSGGADEPKAGRSYLMWPKGSAFYFDGLNVPYNHQNEWAYSVLDTLKSERMLDQADSLARQRAVDIIDHFLEGVTRRGAMPESGIWPYWWGRAARSWTESDGVSINTPAYPGDRLDAFISFKSIDVMSVLSAERFSEPATRPELIAGIRDLVANGSVYPFVSASFVARGYLPELQPIVGLRYARMTAPWEMQNAVWALLSLPLAADKR